MQCLRAKWWSTLYNATNVINIINIIIIKVNNVIVLFSKILRICCGIYHSTAYSPFQYTKYRWYNTRDFSFQFFYYYLPYLQDYRWYYEKNFAHYCSATQSPTPVPAAIPVFWFLQTSGCLDRCSCCLWHSFVERSEE